MTVSPCRMWSCRPPPTTPPHPLLIQEEKEKRKGLRSSPKEKKSNILTWPCLSPPVICSWVAAHFLSHGLSRAQRKQMRPKPKDLSWPLSTKTWKYLEHLDAIKKELLHNPQVPGPALHWRNEAVFKDTQVRKMRLSKVKWLSHEMLSCILP